MNAHYRINVCRFTVLVILAFLIALSACGQGEGGANTYEDPQFVGFNVEPDLVCISDFTSPRVSVSWEIDQGSTDPENDNFPACVYVSANGRFVSPRQCLDNMPEGGGTRSGGMTFNLSTIFTTSMPAQVTILGRLCGGVGCDLETANNDYDRASETISTQICGNPTVEPPPQG